MRPRRSLIRSSRDRRVAIALIVAMLSPGTALAQQPQGGQVVQGSATIATPSSTSTTITQGSQRAIIDWQDFSIGAGGVVNIQQPGATAALLNRVTGGNLSVINGQLQANGRVYLINPQGIVVGPNGTIDTASFVGSTLNTSNDAFMAGGPLAFAGHSTAGVINLGTIRTPGGDVVIIAPAIVNGGSISAPGGAAALLSGQEVLYAPGSSSPFLIKAPVTGGGGPAIENRGVIQAAEAVLKSAGSAFAIAVNGGGEISAASMNQVGGRILLEGDGNIAIGAGTMLRANSIDRGDGGSIVIKSGAATTFEGAIEAKGGAFGGDGGFAEVSGRQVSFGGAVDLTAAAGNTGTMLIDPVTVNIDAFTAANIATNLDAANFEVQADNDINVNSAIVNLTTTNTLTLNAPTVAVNQNITMPSGEVHFGTFATGGTSVTSAAGATISANLIGIRSAYQNVNFAGPLLAPVNGVSYNPQAGVSTTPGSFFATNAANQIKNLYLTNGAVTLTGNVDVRSSISTLVANKLNVAGSLTLVSSGDLAFGGGSPTFNVGGLTRLASTGGVFNNNGSLVLGGAGRKLIYSSTTAGAFNVTGLGYTQITGVSFPNDPVGVGNVIYIAAGASLPLLTITADNKSITYGDADPLFTASFLGGTAANLTSPVLFQIAVAHSNVGAYAITPFGAASTSHQLVYVPGILTVMPAPLLISGPTLSIPYGSAIPAFTPTYNGFRGSDGPSVVSGLVLTSNVPAGAPIGTYTIVPSGASAPNYTISYANGALTITPAVLRIIANSASRRYGAANPLLSASYTGLVNGDTPSVVSGVSLSTTATERSSVGQYPIVVSGGSASNYVIEHVPGTLTVTRAPLSVSTTGANVIYGEALPALTNSVTGLVAGDTVEALGLNYATTVVPGTNVGTYLTTLVGSFANYDVSYSPGVIRVSPRALFITANDAKRYQYQDNPVFTATISGLFGDDTVDGLRLTTVATPRAAAGTYRIVPQSDLMSNYVITHVNGTLTVEQPPVVETRYNPADFNLDLSKEFAELSKPPESNVKVLLTGTGLNAVLNNSPSVIDRVLANYADFGGKYSTEHVRYLMRNNLTGTGGNHEIGTLLPFLVGEAKEIIDRAESTWTSEERAFINYMTGAITAQKKAAAEEATRQLEAWKKDQQAAVDKQGVGLLFSIDTVPPDHFLKQAQTGVALNLDNTAMVVGLMATAGTVAVGTVGAITSGVAASVVGAIAPNIGLAAAAAAKAAIMAGAAGTVEAASAAAAATATAAAGAAIAIASAVVVVAAVAAIVVTAVQVANVNEYDAKMKTALDNAQKPMTNADLKQLLSNKEGQQAAFMYLATNAANNATK